MRLGLCCLFRDQPIKFVTITATAIGKLKRSDALAKLSRLFLANADALLAALHYCDDNGIGCFPVNSQPSRAATTPTPACPATTHQGETGGFCSRTRLASSALSVWTGEASSASSGSGVILLVGICRRRSRNFWKASHYK